MANARSGAAWFEAMGRSEVSRGIPRSPKFYAWPAWAQQAYARGKLFQGSQNIQRRLRKESAK